MAKVSKASVDYRAARPAAPKRCGTCSMFRHAPGIPHGTCTLVAGQIKASDVCDRWARK